jgi:transcriptional regulator with XRE-family HTH domain
MPSVEMGTRIRQLREAAGLSQPAAAMAAGVPVGTLRNWEYGRREPLLSAAGRLAKALGCSVDALLEPPAPEPEDTAPAPIRRGGRPRKASSKASEAGQQADGPEVASKEDRPAAAKPARKRKGGK